MISNHILLSPEVSDQENPAESIHKLVMNHHFVFVYGTLKKGFKNHYLLHGKEFINYGETVEKYALYVDDIPFVVKNKPVSHIQGEVYSVDNKTLVSLDRLEQHPSWYCRELTKVYLKGRTEKIMAWLYFYPHPEGVLEESGSYAV